MTDPASRRGLSPVVGAVLLVAIVVVLSALVGTIMFGLTDETDPRPAVTLDLTTADEPGQQWITHRQGEGLDGDRLRLRGVANPDGIAGSRLIADARHKVWPVEERIEVVWFGDNDESYVIQEFEVDPDTLLPPPDEGCAWVDAESNGGTDQVKIDDLVVNCDVETDELVEVRNGGTVVGDTVSRSKELDADDARFYGSVTVEKVANLQNVSVTGSVTSDTADVKLDDSTAESSVTAAKVAEAIDGSTVDGDLVSETKDAKVLNSTVSGSVTANGTVKLDGATVEGDVYADSGDFDCTDSEINGSDCGPYSPKDPGEY